MKYFYLLMETIIETHHFAKQKTSHVRGSLRSPSQTKSDEIYTSDFNVMDAIS